MTCFRKKVLKKIFLQTGALSLLLSQAFYGECASASATYSLFSSSAQANLKTFYNNEAILLPITRLAGLRLDVGMSPANLGFEALASATMQFANDLSSIDTVILGLGARYFFSQASSSMRSSKGPFSVSVRELFSPFMSASFIVTRVSLGFLDADRILQKVASSSAGINLGIGFDWLPNFLQQSPDGFRYLDDPRRAIRTELSYSYAPLTADSSPSFYSDIRLIIGLSM